MQEYAYKNTLVTEIRNTANLFIKEFDDISEADKNVRYDEVYRIPQQNT